MRKATLILSDLHYGDAGQLHGTLQECVGRAIQAVNAFGPDETEALIDGDAVAGRGIFRNQGMQNALQFGREQCWWAAHDIARWQERLGASRWIIVRGNHDSADSEDLAQQLVGLLQLMGVNATYSARTFTGNFACAECDGQWYEAEHGFGNSDYYANSYTEIRAMWRKYIERSKLDKINLSRIILGHTHWLNVGQAMGQDLAIDTCGGWHRQERDKIAADIRDTGVLLYLHDGQALRIEPVHANADRLRDESRDVGLHYQNMAAGAQALQAVTAWAHERGLC